MIFQCACQDFPYWRIVVPHSIQKNQLFSLPGESPHHNFITHPVFSITKERIELSEQFFIQFSSHSQ